MEWFLKVVRDNYANFEGRARRKEYWMFILWQFIILIPLYILLLVAQSSNMNILAMLVGIAFSVISLLLIVPTLAVVVRRLHDIGRSGWFYFVGFIPLVGGFVLLFWLASDGNVGPNEYGEDPKAGEPGH